MERFLSWPMTSGIVPASLFVETSISTSPSPPMDSLIPPHPNPRWNLSGERIHSKVQMLQILHLSDSFRNPAIQTHLRHPQKGKAGQVPELLRNARRKKRVGCEPERLECRKIRDFQWNDAIEEIVIKVESFDRRKPGNGGRDVAGEVVGGENQVSKVSRHPIDISGELAEEEVLRDVEVLESGTVVENRGKGARDVVEGEVEVGETMEVANGRRDRSR
ncbi:hypothetical protein IEQ34_013071 [Dendrobium chrysotoxum]|uniref:Uncharacterized protein n=1 Tax=Dendrobium chrysotoxum TaxID=161865 RepID=A0AAV7GMF7_DENCH|nr:hypothetical protein IEQ34_013071 [Dendrobium chrysotoxum]